MTKEAPASAFIARLAELSVAIEENRRAQRVMPTLILLFTSIDALSALERRRASRSSFVAWVDKFLLAETPAPWTAWDLYAARCSILHTLTSDSGLTDKKQARPMLYAWGNADDAVLRRAVSGLPTEFAVLHLDDLVSRFNHAVSRVLDLAEGSDDRAARIREGASRWYMTISASAPHKVID